MKNIPGLQTAVHRMRCRFNNTRCSTLRHLIVARGHFDVLLLSGMRRSGNHLAINWILNQTEGATVFYNNVRPGAHPYTARQKEAVLNRPIRRSRLVFSYEDQSLDDMLAGPLPALLSTLRERPNVRVSLGVILRDPYNLFASRYRKWPERFRTIEDIAAQRNLYLQHAALAFGTRTILEDIPVIPILYNRLLSEAAYRSRLATDLNIADGIRGLDDVPTYGHGSSFDGTQTSGKALRNSVLERWKESLNEPAFAQAIDDPEIRRLAQATFGMTLKLS